MESWGDESAILRAVVDAHTGHGHKMLVEVVGVLGIGSYDILLLVHALSEVGLTEVVVVERCAEGQIMFRSEISLEHQL